MRAATLYAFLRPLTNILIVAVFICKITSIGLSFKMIYVCGERLLFLLLNLHKMGYGCVDVTVTYFQSQ